MKIEVLYIDECPHFPAIVDAVKRGFGAIRPHLSGHRNERDGSEDRCAYRLSRITHRPHRRFGYPIAPEPLTALLALGPSGLRR
jgi:hypothetical protein